jgi:putative spermidine/putrescine transport system permease protein
MSEARKIVLMLTPALAVIGVLFLGGLVIGLARSFGYSPNLGMTNPSLDAYRAVFSDPAFFGALGLSLYISVASTVISAVIAMGAALLLRRSFRGRGLAMFFFQLNLTVPHLVGAIGILYLFSQSGSFARLAFAAGMIAKPSDFPALIYDPYAIGIILQYVWKEVPFIGMIMLANMQTLGHDYEAVARSHGANRWQAFRFILLPMLSPALISSSVIVFVFAFGAYEIPLLLGQNYPAALPVLAYRSYVDVDLVARPQALAMGMVIAAISAVMVGIYLWAARVTRR